MARKSIDIKYVKRLQRGDPEAFEEIFRFYKDSVYYFSLTYVKNKADAEEVVQETFIQALKHIDTLQKPKSFHSWLHRIAYNKSMTLYKKNGKLVQLDSDYDIENIIEAEEGPSSMLSRRELITTIQNEIEKMPKNLIHVAQLRYFDDFTTREISEIMDIPEGTVKTRLNKVRKIIQPKLRTKGFTPAKYLSFAFTPVMFEAFKEIISNYELSANASAKIMENMSDISQGLLAGLAAGTGGYGAVSSLRNGIQTTTKVTVAAVSGAAGIYGIYQVAQPASAYIEQISYYDQLTNGNVEVEVLLHGNEAEDNIEILRDGKTMSFNLTDDVLLFEAILNGEYTIRVGEDSHTLSITNIDKHSPELSNVVREGDSLTFSYQDDFAGIDYDKSYFISNGEKVSLPETGKLNGDYSGLIEVYLYDKAGNMAEFEVDLDA